MQKKNKVNPILQWWIGPNLPVEHIWVKPENRPKGLRKKFRMYYRKWLIHPCKRRIAKYYLALLRKVFNLKVVGITGSAGKTTVKDTVTHILTKQGETVSSYKNIDPIYNIPTTILKCRPSTKYLVLEMGVEYVGEMDFYLWLARPDTGIITNIFPTHLEFFGSEDGVFKEKSKLAKGLNKSSSVVLESGDKFLKKLNGKIDAREIWYGKRGDYKYNKISQTESGVSFVLETGDQKFDVEIPLLGKQFVSNTIGAIAVCVSLGVDIKSCIKALSSIEPTEHRMNIIRHKSHAVIIDDSYNNNPKAAKAAIDTISDHFKNKNKYIVFGDMLELGKNENRYHKDVGAYIRKNNFKGIIGVGPLSKLTVDSFGGNKKYAMHVESEDKIDNHFKTFCKKNSVILIKGSRSIGLDKFVSRL